MCEILCRAVCLVASNGFYPTFAMDFWLLLIRASFLVSWSAISKIQLSKLIEKGYILFVFFGKYTAKFDKNGKKY